MKSVYGYINPPFTVNDFVPIVYRENDDYFVAEIKDFKIADFITIDETGFVIEPITWIENKVDINSPALFGFLNDMNVLRADWPNTLFDFYIKSLRRATHNVYTKLSIANLLDLVGLKYKLIEKINGGFSIQEYDYTYPFVDEAPFEPYTDDKKQAVAETIYMLNQLAHQYHLQLTWNDLIYIWKDHVYVGAFKIDSKQFKRDFPEAKSILLDYCTPQSLTEQLKTIKANKETFMEWIPAAKTALADTHHHEVLKDYYIEKHSPERVSEYGQRLSEVALKHLTNQFNSILAFCNAE
ncbi:hypothetical protein [Paraflavitalea sp. CAU 1676]|uniref:hypothetical protein n=1 Tax=Paraflavitalea sp. CAU 1676 TaxID=3032598 RepID=UPI0023D9B2BE|nr:hypothetical protein [Paraflavitalea sp. CAU 1676]MDF2188364.1 hypothetical protein [Paraflavitalea sp. CAU 1676]